MAKIVVMGAGSWGTTLAILLAKKGNQVTLWEYKKERAEKLKKNRENIDYVKGIKFPDTLEVTNDINGLLDGCEYLIFSIPSQFLRGIVSMVSDQIKENMILINTGKGIEISTHERLSEVIKDEILGKFHNNIVVLSGPTHAEEVSKEFPSAIVAASKDEKVSKKVQELFNTDFFRVYSNNDLIGVEIGGALKNCIAIAAGITDGMGFGDNSKSAIITRGLAEIIRFGEYFGADFKTFSGLSGVGDLITTCTSKHSRNRFVGEKLGEGKTIEDIMREMIMVAEGVPTAKAVHEIAKEKGIEMPVVESVYKIIYESEKPKVILQKLMSRELKGEFYK
ncbi:NAD(P)H-dependent glycerol-3-phosphate dehydrogenase [Haliovirga abyssi]|uniref:Glycerol-3-phosphate dehydrogenase [NAD(P)+] n=1 Tax=Haliovirga abyssi TaxID=2996794 RepID=A0AAU9DAR8_9FUSO|nr:NAD(P)H-dependent glycerol-3-phosphate dehydrogenase [Haliovirga abyssi]BDU50646.1 glycerol-3-phosphate dehydrogenase [NAD(P)+] [Haliovirga abyssi]